MTDPDRASTAPGTPAGPRPGPLPPLRPNRPPESPLSRTRSGYDRPPRLLAALIGRSGEVQSLSAVLLLGMLMLLAGLEVVRTTPELDFTYDGAIEGILSQLAITGPAAVLVALATTANVLAGAAALRLAGAPAFRSPTDMVLAGFTTAVILDAGTLFLLGSAGLFGWPELVLLHAAVAIGWLALRKSRGPLLARPVRVRLSRPAAWWPLVLAIWAGPLIVQLASPALPFMDVLPNHVAPVEHVRVFGSFATLTTSPSPIYGPSRLMLGYVALLGQLTTITNLDAVLAEAAFALPLTILMALSIRRLTARLFGSSAAFWVLLTFPLTFTFMRIPDVRGTVVVFPVAAWALIRIAEELMPRSDGRPSHPGDGRPKSVDATARGRPDLSLAFALGGAFLLHPLVGLVTFAAAAGALILYPDRLGRTLTPALGAGAIIAIPQALTLGGIGAPAWVGFVCVCLGAGAAFGLAAAVSAVVRSLAAASHCGSSLAGASDSDRHSALPADRASPHPRPRRPGIGGPQRLPSDPGFVHPGRGPIDLPPRPRLDTPGLRDRRRGRRLGGFGARGIRRADGAGHPLRGPQVDGVLDPGDACHRRRWSPGRRPAPALAGGPPSGRGRGRRRRRDLPDNGPDRHRAAW